jgi:hypothetical protein
MHTGSIMKIIVRTIIAVLLVALGSIGAEAQQKLAQTGLKFLNVDTDARSAALGSAMTAVEGSSSSMFGNPAGFARLSGLTSVSINQTQWIADINHSSGTAAFAPWNGEYGVIGVCVQAVDYGDFQETIFDVNTAGFLNLGTFKPNALVIGLGYSRALNEQLAIGGVAKYARQSLGDATVTIGQPKQSNVVTTMAFDFGILYKTGFKSLNFGMTVRNFSQEVRYQLESFQLPLTFKIGLSMNVADLADVDHDMHALRLSIDAEHPRDYAEQVRVGAEYLFMKVLALRIGYVSPADEYGLSYGVGLTKNFGTTGFALDYAYTPFGVFFGSVHRFSFGFSL